MYEFHCRDAGALACGAKIKADSEQQLEEKLVEHVKRKHGVKVANRTLVDHLKAVTRVRQGRG